MTEPRIMASFIGIGASLLLFSELGLLPAAGWFPFVLVMLVAVLGLPHGGLDAAIGARLGIWAST